MQSEGSPDGRLDARLAIFQSVLGVVAFVLPARNMLDRIVLTLAAICLAAWVYRGIQAFNRDRLDTGLTAWMAATLVLGIVYAALVASGGGERTTVEQQPGPTVTVTVTPTSGTTTPPPSTPPPNSPSPPNSPPNSTPNSTPTLLPFDSSDVGVRSNGTVTLRLGLYGLQLDNRWGSSDGYGGFPQGGSGSDAVFGQTGMSGMEGTQFALLRKGARRSYPTCRTETAWLPSLTWDQLPRGRFACIKTPSGRRGMLRMDEPPDFDNDRLTVQVTGVTWLPIVDR